MDREVVRKAAEKTESLLHYRSNLTEKGHSLEGQFGFNDGTKWVIQIKLIRK